MKTKQFGLERLKIRAARFNRLVEIKAPGSILANNLLMIIDAMWMAHSQDMAEAIRQTEERRVKISLGICFMPECDTESADKETGLCARHQREFDDFEDPDDPGGQKH